MSERRVWKRRLRLLAHFAAYKVRHPSRRPGYVTVVVPVYNVEAYVGDCLESLLKQHHRRLEIVVVDDGSPDRSIDVVRRYMQRDKRIRLVTQQNRGLSGARNAGAAVGRGEYIAFLDSDDTVEARAYETAVESLRVSGSDFAVFSYRRLNNQTFVEPGRWIGQAHNKLRRGVTVSEYPDILVNAVAWSKVYTRDFWDRAGLEFPEGVLYEDQPVSAAAYLAADAFDVLPDQLVNWRVRDDGQSISQQVRDLRDLEHRLDAATDTLRLLAANPIAHRARLAQVLTNDVKHSIRAVPQASDEFYALLRDKLRVILAELDEQDWAEIAVPMKVVYQLIVDGTQAEATAFVENGGLGIDAWLTHAEDGRIVADVSSIVELETEIEPWRTVLGEHEAHLETTVRRCWWGADGSLTVTGWALIANTEDPDQAIAVRLVDASGAPVAELAVEQDTDDEVQVIFKHRRYTYPHSHFRATLAPGDVPSTGTWALEVVVTANGVTRSGTVRAFVDVAANRQLTSVVADGRQLRTLSSPDLDLAVESLAGVVGLRRLTLVGTVLTADVDGAVTGLRLRGAGGPSFTRDSGSRWRADVAGWGGVAGPAATLQAETTAGWVPVRAPRGEDVRVLGRVGAVALVGESIADGAITVGRHERFVLLDHFAVDGNTVTFDGVAHGLGPRPTMSVERPAHRVEAPCDVDTDGRFAVSIALDAGQWGFAGTALPRGGYSLRFRSDLAGHVPVIPRAAASYLERLPLDVRTDTMTFRMTSSRPRNPLVTVRPHIADAERSAHGVARLRDENPTLFPPIREDAVLFRTFYGENTTCCARGIHRELVARGADLTLYWAIKDFSVPVPEGGIGVVAGSAEWHELMRTAKYLVDNVHQPEFFVKRPEQIFVQTFHGYPFKQMGLPYWREHGYSQGRIDSFVRRAKDWDYVVSPASYATPLLADAFGFEGEMLEIGYPRNDLFFSPDVDVLGKAVRARLGIGEDQLVVLYAPTYRDWLSSTEFVAPLVDYFDYDEFAAAFGADAVLLLRGHAMNARHKNRVDSQSAVIDVTDYPEINDLILACDVAVVDYSSIRFDLAVAGKPMIFLVPDLERYKGDRGALMEYEPTAPGPLVSTTAQVVAHLRDLDGLRSAYAEQTARFRADYLDLDAGHASARLVDRVFGDASRPR